ncbi:MAG: D-tyrosyl-tRNA(Tyr) deacylase [Acidobacteria bacterium]|nr:D-tyrosyl-tRNA(Tyr) deacylase [Acidobacteriota bacterium]
MKAVVQRVASAAVAVGSRTVGQIGLGLLVFVGVERGDGPADVRYVASKIGSLRLFDDPETGKGFDRSVADVGGSVLVVSQFTLAADCRRGRRPSFDAAAPPDEARQLYEQVVAALRANGMAVETGEFQAMMQVALTNEGPVTLWLDSR